MQMLQYGYLEMMYLINPGSTLFQDPVARTTSGLSCNKAQEVNRRGSSTRGVRATSAWDSAPALRLLFPPELNFNFAVRAMACALSESPAACGASAPTSTASALLNDSVTLGQQQAHSCGGGGGFSGSELVTQASGPTVNATTGAVCGGGLRSEVFAVLSWLKAILPALPSLCTLGVAAHLLGNALFDGQSQPERNDSSAIDVQYSVRHSLYIMLQTIPANLSNGYEVAARS